MSLGQSTWEGFKPLSIGSALEFLNNELEPSAEDLDPNTSLADFAKQAFSIVYPGQVFRWGWHLDAISYHLEAVSAGEIRFLIINIPPRHMKSGLCSVMWPDWDWLKHPERGWLFASYAEKLAMRDALYSRWLIQSQWYQRNFGHLFGFRPDQNTKLRFENTRGGFRASTVLHGLGTGEGGDIRVLDDPQSTEDADYPNELERASAWRRSVWATRFRDPKKSASVLIQQRVHEADITGDLIEQMLTEAGSDEYEMLVLPHRYQPINFLIDLEPYQKISREHKDLRGLGDRELREMGKIPASGVPRDESLAPIEADLEKILDAEDDGTFVDNRPGGLLWRERFGEDEYRAQEIELQDKAAGQLGQDPASGEHNTFKRAWFSPEGTSRVQSIDPTIEAQFMGRNRYDYASNYLRNLVRHRWLSYDTAFTDDEANDATGLVVWEMLPNYLMLVRYADEFFAELPDLLGRMKADKRKYNRDSKLRGMIIEHKGSGIDAVSTLRHDPEIAPYLIPFNPGVYSKTYRARQAAVWCNRDCILLPYPDASLDWLEMFEERFFKFPANANKKSTSPESGKRGKKRGRSDVVDAFSQFVIHNEHRIARGFVARGGTLSEAAA